MTARQNTSVRETAGDRWLHFTWKCPEKNANSPELWSPPTSVLPQSILLSFRNSSHPRDRELEEAEWDLITSSLLPSRNVRGF